MKNIHILPTDNYAPLVHSTNKYGGYFKSEHYSPMKEMGDSYQHIYITSDEEIKAGDWYYLPRTNLVYECTEDPTELNLERSLGVRKIILTTDPDLIKDGVQAIDDEFLEWFVKNPSCESVVVEEEKKAFDNEHRGIPFALDEDDYVKKIYKIIIPKEEPEQEILEEDLLNTAIQVVGDNNITTIKEFLVKHKWQAERRYSEEEAFNLCREFAIFVQRNGPSYTKQQEWFEQFKKK